MFLHKLKMTALVGLSFTILLGGAGAVARQFGGASAKPAAPELKSEFRATAPDDPFQGDGDLKRQIHEAYLQFQKQLDASRATEKELKQEVAALRKELDILKAHGNLGPLNNLPPGVSRPPAGAFAGAGGLGGQPFAGAGGQPFAGAGGQPFAGPAGVSGQPFAGGFGGGIGGGIGAMGGMGGGFRPRRPEVPTIQTDLIVAVADPQKKKVPAYSAETGRWVTYEAPAGVTLLPIVGGDVLALQATGHEISEVAVFNGKDGKWYPQELREPAKGSMIPIVAPDVAVFPAGRYCYAYSVPAGRWDILELEKGAEANPAVGRTFTTVEHAGHLYLFNHKHGKWEDFDSKAK